MKKQLNTASITNELEGASAFFTKPSPTPSETLVKPDILIHSPLPSQPAPSSHTGEVSRKKQERQQGAKPTSNQTITMASNITILQLLDAADIENLREPAYQAQTFRLTEREIEWVKDTAYRLSKEMKRKKVSQADILRISFKLFEQLLAAHKADLLRILERIK